MAALTSTELLLLFQVCFANEEVRWSNTAPICCALGNTGF